MSYTQIKLDITDGIATITLHRPEKMNAFTRVMMQEVIDALDVTDADDAVRAVIVTGHGDRAFCAGADLTPEGGGHVFSDPNPVSDLSDERVRDGGGRLTLRMFNSRKPLIGACNGVAVGVGATMQLPFDMRLCSDNARFGFVFARRGITPEAASSWFLPRLVGMQTALEWCMTGRIFDAAEAKERGLVRSVHPQGELMDAARSNRARDRRQHLGRVGRDDPRDAVAAVVGAASDDGAPGRQPLDLSPLAQPRCEGRRGEFPREARAGLSRYGRRGHARFLSLVGRASV